MTYGWKHADLANQVRGLDPFDSDFEIGDGKCVSNGLMGFRFINMSENIADNTLKDDNGLDVYFNMDERYSGN